MKLLTHIFTGLAACLLSVAAIANPVQFYTFDASFVEGGVELTWSTISETSSLHFIVQRSMNGSDWTDIGTIDGQGNSSTYIEYNYVDDEQVALKLYYRIRQVDLTGMSFFSNVITVKTHQLYIDSVKAFPNPAVDRLTVPLTGTEESAVVEILDSLGKPIMRQEYQAPCTAELDIASLPKGYYYLRIQSLDAEKMQRIFKQ